MVKMWIKLPQMDGYLNIAKETEYMFFLIKHNQLLEKCNEKWDNITYGMKI